MPTHSGVLGRLAGALALSSAIDVSPLAAQRADAVRGQVFDSLAGQPLAGAAIRLTRLGDDTANAVTAVSDSNGRFRIVAVAPGTWMVSFTHPALQVLGIDLDPDAIRITGGSTVDVALAIPSAGTVREAYCAAAPQPAGEGVIVGYVRGTPARDASDSLVVLASWSSRNGGATLPTRDSVRRIVTVAANGWYGLCAGESASGVTLSVLQGRTLLKRESMQLPASGVLFHSVEVLGLSGQQATMGTTAKRVLQTIAVQGVVLAADGRTPVVGATVAVAGSGITRTDARGRWTMRAAAPGLRTVTVRALGYTLASRVRLLGEDTLLIADTLVRLPTVIDEVTVRADAVTPSLRAFLDRSRTRGTGTFLKQDDIASRRPTFLSEVFSSVQGGITIERDSLGNKYLMMRSNTLRNPRCFPSIFIDGMNLRGLTNGDLDGLLRPSELFGIEIYRAANAPAEFNHQDGCGTILIWTTALQSSP